MNKSIVIASLRLGKTSVDAIKNLNKYKSGILEQLHFDKIRVWFLLTHGLDYAF